MGKFQGYDGPVPGCSFAFHVLNGTVWLIFRRVRQIVAA